MYERYERIVKSLRSCMRLEESAFECIEMDGGCCDSIGRCIPHLMDEAADAIEELQRTQMSSAKWIPVEERLPNGNGEYLVSGNDKVWVCEFMILGGVGGWCNNARNPCVKAWMPKPKPYEPPKGEN